MIPNAVNTKRILFLLTLLLFAVISARGQQTASAFSQARTLPEKSYDPTQFEFSVANDNYTIFKSGRGLRKRDGKARSFNLRISRFEYLTREIYYMEYQGDVLLVCEVTTDLEGGGFIARLDGRTLKIKWKRDILGFNVGQGLMDGKYAYVTGIGFIGKLDLSSGRYVWQHSDLYQPYTAFSIFELPEVQGEFVIFREQPDYTRKKQAVIKVDRATGKIISLDH